ncbi:FecCD family ABC transporter permease [Nocardioides sp. Kera G14]|uniref:FecCD family ABC transporter permease n=1 Tax=Nocardioides sp. Kera G14 TaxID=2884264 RepID=UPI001D0FE4BB|nr:iron chelate uptake ABC transporter family permease subunit [Nocardioides sp. Kera G14]UDY23223.1 iron ABC transporter permease [Nocardioides sp. Kera G14]
MTALEAPRPVDVVRRARRVPQRRLALVVGGLVVVLVAVFFARVLGGDYTITFPDFLRILGGKDIPGATFILKESKLPRAVMGLLVGVAFGTAGEIFQSTLRNPLASPDMVGVSMGASASAVFAIVVLDLSGTSLSIAAVIGAVLTAAAIRLVAGPDATYRLVLVGVTAAAALMAVIEYLFTRADEYDAQLALRWLTGSLNAADWPAIRSLTLFLVVLLPLVAWAAQAQRSLELGRDVASGLGVSVAYADGLLLAAVLLTALGVAAAGPVAFVAFAAGPIARTLNGGRSTLLGAALVGATVVVGADYLAAYGIPDVNLPVGVVTGAFGAPFLLWLLASGRTGRRSA